MTTDSAVTRLAHPSLPPGPRGDPLLGSARALMRKDVLTRYREWWTEYGDIVYVKLGPRPGYVLFHPDHVHHVLVANQRNYVKGPGYDGFRMLAGQGLVTSDGELWRRQRRLMQPPFTATASGRFAPMMAEAVETMLEAWQVAAERELPLTMDEEMRHLTMSVIARALFSIDLDKELKDIGQAFQNAFAFIFAHSMSQASLPFSSLLPLNRRFRRELAVIDDFIGRRIEVGEHGGTSDNLLSILLSAKDPDSGQSMSRAQLRDEIVTLFFAGFETTARSLTWLWYLLGRHPQARSRLEAEVDQVIGTRRPSFEDVDRLTYTQMVIDETLRLYPPTALLGREAVAEDEIGGYSIPAGAMVIPVPFIVHRHPRYWPNPDEFNPERFAPEAVAQRPKPAYIPFSSGPRVCLGNSFALLEMSLAVGMAVARFRLEPVSPEPIPEEFAGTTRPTRPVVMRVLPRPD
jgi:cytochrome P450